MARNGCRGLAFLCTPVGGSHPSGLTCRPGWLWLFQALLKGPNLGDLYDQSRSLFIRRWGEMGAAWGISRTMAEIHALLFVSTRPLCTDDVMDRLQISRGNTSINLRQLVNWELIHRVHRPGDRIPGRMQGSAILLKRAVQRAAQPVQGAPPGAGRPF